MNKKQNATLLAKEIHVLALNRFKPLYIFRYLEFLNNVKITKTKVLLPQAYLTLAQLGYSVVVLRAPVFTLLPMTFELFSFPVDCL
jgi:hypothetical protein